MFMHFLCADLLALHCWETVQSTALLPTNSAVWSCCGTCWHLCKVTILMLWPVLYS